MKVKGRISVTIIVVFFICGEARCASACLVKKKTTEPSPASASVSKYMCLPGTGFGLECPENTHKRTLPRNVHFPVDFFDVKKRAECVVVSVPRQISSVAASGPAREGSREGIAVCAPCCHIDRRGEGGRHVDGWASEMEEEGRREGPSRSRLHTNSRSMEQLPYGKQGEEDEEGKATYTHTSHRYSRYLELESATMTISTAWQVPPLAKRTATDQIFPKQARREKSDRIFKSRRLRPSLRDQKQQYKTGGGGGATT